MAAYTTMYLYIQWINGTKCGTRTAGAANASRSYGWASRPLSPRGHAG